jgi:hypothetical protein
VSGPIVAHEAPEPNCEPPSAPQSFTIRCAECGDTYGSHLPHCPGVLAIGYDTGRGAASMVVYPDAGSSMGKHNDALGTLRFYSIFGPVEMDMEDGRVISFMDLPLK